MDAFYLAYIKDVIAATQADTLVTRDDAGLSEFDGLTIVLLTEGPLYDTRVLEFRVGDVVVARAKLP